MTAREQLQSAPVFRQTRIGLCHPPTLHEIETRYRCIEAHHEGRLYNPAIGGTFCMCGRVVWPGDVAVRLSPYERAENDVGRRDEVGRGARAYLDQVHGRSVPDSTKPAVGQPDPSTEWSLFSVGAAS